MFNRYVAHGLTNGLLPQLLLWFLVTVRYLTAPVMANIDTVRTSAGRGRHMAVCLEALAD